MVDLNGAQTFLATAGRPLEAAWGRWLGGEGEREAVIAALTPYQNADGGFGNGLEPDIGAPASNPFAARLALHVLLSLGATADDAPVARLSEWLEAAQDKDGCWRLPPDLAAYPVAPWFAAWTFPSLNPALCLAGLADRLGIGSERLHERVRRLFASLASREEIASGEYYAVLPYAEYLPWVEVPEREAMLATLIEAIAARAERGGYDDAGHFFEHVGPAAGAIARGLDAALIAAWLDRLAAEQQPDGGWPSPYAAHWRPWATASALQILRDYRRI